EIPLKQRTKVYTGRSETKICYRILGQELFGGERMESGYEYFDAIATERDIKLFGWIELPIREYRIVYREYTVLYSDIGEDEAEERVRLALDDALSLLDCEILSVDTVITTDKKRGVCLLKADATVKRDIAREVPYEILKFPKDSKRQANK
ncbi:MAG: sporulation protein YqfD, partial [Clostridia bacterium]|nr:sporulation protein YqfD [Clostridia bacterium]